MVGLGTALVLLALWFALGLLAPARPPRRHALVPAAGGRRRRSAPTWPLESGWIVTEVGRQPWIVYQILRTEDAVTNTGESAVWTSLIVIMCLYAAIATGPSWSSAA